MRLFLAAVAVALPCLSVAADRPPLDHGKPLFTSRGTPLCDTEAGLTDLLQHTRAGVKGISNGDYGCIAAMDGWDVHVLQSKGVLDRWDRVSTAWGSGNRDFWTPDWALRN